MDWELAGETQVVRENILQCQFFQHKSHMTWPEIETGLPLWEAGMDTSYNNTLYTNSCIKFRERDSI
jgi:hypothetical protein